LSYLAYASYNFYYLKILYNILYYCITIISMIMWHAQCTYLRLNNIYNCVNRRYRQSTSLELERPYTIFERRDLIIYSRIQHQGIVKWFLLLEQAQFSSPSPFWIFFLSKLMYIIELRTMVQSEFVAHTWFWSYGIPKFSILRLYACPHSETLL